MTPERIRTAEMGRGSDLGKQARRASRCLSHTRLLAGVIGAVIRPPHYTTLPDTCQQQTANNSKTAHIGL